MSDLVEMAKQARQEMIKQNMMGWPNVVLDLIDHIAELETALCEAIKNKEKAEQERRICEVVFRSAIQKVVPYNFWRKLDQAMLENIPLINKIIENI